MILGVCLQPSCLVVEHCKLGSLADVLENHRPGKRDPEKMMEWPQLIQLAFDSAKGLEYLHTQR